MKTLRLTQFGNPILRTRAKRIALKSVQTASLQKLIRAMFATVYDIGVGLAAPQIGESIKLAVIDIHPLPHRPHVELYRQVIINPVITRSSKKTTYDYEGCLSCPGLRGKVRRSNEVTVEWYDEHGEKHHETVQGLRARVFQHEIDHVNGILYVDRMTDMRTLMTVEEYNKRLVRK